MNRFLGVLLLTPLIYAFGFPQTSQGSASSPVTNTPLKFEARADLYSAVSLNSFIFERISVPEGGANQQIRCLAQAVYFEARSEPIEGQLAVAQVVLNRVEDQRYPSSICAVVFQNEHRLNRCQFSFACDGLSDTPFERRAWDIAQRIALVAMSGQWHDVSGAATHYHADYVDPYWNAKMQRTAEYGRHAFYRES